MESSRFKESIGAIYIFQNAKCICASNQRHRGDMIISTPPSYCEPFLQSVRNFPENKTPRQQYGLLLSRVLEGDVDVLQRVPQDALRKAGEKRSPGHHHIGLKAQRSLLNG